MEVKRDNPRPDHRRPRRKKRKKGPSDPIDKRPLQQAKPQKKPVPAAKPGAPGKPHQDRRREPPRDKPSRGEPTPAAPRDLRLGSTNKEKGALEEPPFRHVMRRYGVAVYDSFAAAKADKDAIAAKAKEVDQFNIVIRAEGNMDDPELLALGPVKIFAGAAWTLIHERRIQDGWYESPR